MRVPHFEKVDLQKIEAVFSDDGLHRSYLRIPLLMRGGDRTVCIIGQNPSYANAAFADKTIRFLERFVFDQLPEFSQILMLNLYSRIDTKKEQIINLQDPECERVLRQAIRDHNDFLMVFGKLRSDGAYRFQERANELRVLFSGKNAYKIDIGSPFAPHPGNPNIRYSNYSLGVTCYDFSDVKA